MAISRPGPLNSIGARLQRAVPRTLRWRLAAWVAVVMIAASGVTYIVVWATTGSEVRRQIDNDMAGDVKQFAQALMATKQPTPATVEAAARGYVDAQTYISTDTVFFVLIPGAEPISNVPEVFAAPGAQVDALQTPRIGYQDRHVPVVGKLRVYEERVRVGGLTAVIGTGEPEAQIERATEGVGRAFAVAGTLSVLLALLASYFAGARVTAPLRRMAGVAARVDGGDLEPRMESPPGGGEEVRVLADAFNRMLDRLSEAFAGQRAFVADASHELRTPLTVMRGQIELLSVGPHPSPEELERVTGLVQSEILRISRLVDDLLLLAQAENRHFLRYERTEIGPFVDEVWNGLSLTADRNFELGDLPAGWLNADPDRLAQVLRNLGRNAVEHTRPTTGTVRLDLMPQAGGRLRFTVRDDGPGIPASERQAVFDRFHRTEPGRARAHGGAGLGLAIVRAIAEAHGGSVRAVDPDTGGELRGARIELELPGYSTR